MSWLNNLFRKSEKPLNDTVLVDLHSHLLPGIDDGCENIEQSIELIREFEKLGRKKLITTPHIMGDYYRNTPEIILPKLEELRARVKLEGIDMQLEAAAEYYLDETLIHKLDNNEPLLTIGDKYVLFETSFLNSPTQLDSLIFKLKSNGYKPILAHPERYTYLINNFEKIDDIISRGVYFQVNINSLAGYYSKTSKELAEKLIDKGLVHFISSDCHNDRQMAFMQKSIHTPYYKKVLQLPLLNNSLIQ
jgi:protein-tyrosine phosphatase